MSKNNDFDHEFANIIRQKIAALLIECRTKKNRSVRTLARKLKIKKKHIKKWEAGKGCPPNKALFAMLGHYGNGSMEAFQKLDCDLQILKYQRFKAKNPID